jgi:hypothetical protein
LALAVILVSLSLSGCTASKKDPLAELKGGYSAHLLIRINGIEAQGSVLASPSSADKGRSVRLSLDSPSALRGLSIVFSENGGATVSLGASEFSVSEQEASRLFSFGSIYKILSAEGSISSISSAKGKDIGIPELERVTQISLDDAIIYIDPEDSSPVKAVCSSSGCEIFFYSFSVAE